MSALRDHLKNKLTHVCRCWAITRKDGRVFGFTDHDQALNFDGITFKADSGMTARTLEQVTGLAVDNTEAMGALSDVSVTETDINAGRFDGAKVEAWLVHWPDVAIRERLFCGSIGELRRADGAFHAELRGLSEQLSQPVGQVFQQGCQALLGGQRCGFDLDTPGFRLEVEVSSVERNRVFTFSGFSAFDARWFERGRLEVLGGAAEGLTALIKNDRIEGADRVIELWEELRAPVTSGDLVLLEAGCDKRKETCRLKFNNFKNFRGFPHIPGEDWLVGYPSQGDRNDGGSRYQ
ncbi:MAG: DUF2163 domain-containing protein [Pseudomonadota bacterium]